MTRSHTIQTAQKRVWPLFWQFTRPHWLLFFLMLLLIAIYEASLVVERWFISLVAESVASYTAGIVTEDALVNALIWVAIAFSIAAIIAACSRLIKNNLLSELELRMVVDLKRTFFSHILRLSHRFHSSHKSGTLIARLSRGSSALENMMDIIAFNFAPLILQAGFTISILFALNSSFALALSTTIVVFIGYSWFIVQIQKTRREKSNERDDEEKATVADTFTNSETIKYFGKESFALNRYFHKVDASRKARWHEWVTYGYIDFGHIIILSAGLVALIWLSIKGVLAGTASVGELTFVYTAYLGLTGPMNSFVRGIREAARTSTDFASLIQYLENTNEITDLPDASPIIVQKSSIAFENVTFKYRQRDIITGFTLHVKPGEKIAFVGSSGAGKSTIVKLLYRFYDPQEGTISVDGRDIRTAPQEQYREQLAIVPQEGVLFDDTLYNNIAFSKTDATEKEITAAMRLAQLTVVIKRLPEGAQTVVGERGVKLSGGERQRVAIARAILANTKILVLDEATSSLDSETEHAIQQGLQALLKGKTAIIIAHRLSTIMHADRIIVLENGRIVQEGSHKELLKKPGRYKTLWKLQKGGYIGE